MRRNFLVTGASKGIGLALAKLLAAQGHHVIGIARGGAENFPGTLYPLDLGSPGAASALAEIVMRHAIDGVVNNVGLVSRKRSAKST